MCIFFLHLPNLASQEEERGKMAVRERRGREGGNTVWNVGQTGKRGDNKISRAANPNPSVNNFSPCEKKVYVGSDLSSCSWSSSLGNL